MMIVMSRYLDEVLDLCWYFAHRYACILSPFRFSGCAQGISACSCSAFHYISHSNACKAQSSRITALCATGI